MGPVDFEEIRRVKVRVHRLQRATALSSHALTISLSNSPIALHLQVPSVPLPLPSSRCPPPRAPSLSLSPSSHSLSLLTHPPYLPTYLPTYLSLSPSPSLPLPPCLPPFAPSLPPARSPSSSLPPLIPASPSPSHSHNISPSRASFVLLLQLSHYAFTYPAQQLLGAVADDAGHHVVAAGCACVHLDEMRCENARHGSRQATPRNRPVEDGGDRVQRVEGEPFRLRGAPRR